MSQFKNTTFFWRYNVSSIVDKNCVSIQAIIIRCPYGRTTHSFSHMTHKHEFVNMFVLKVYVVYCMENMFIAGSELLDI